MNLEDIIIAFSIVLKKEGLSLNTIIAYGGAVRQYYMRSSEINIKQLQDYKSYLLNNYSVNTANVRICGINRYLTYLESHSDFAFLPLNYRLLTIKMTKKTFTDNVISQQDYDYFKNCLKRDENYFWYFVIRFLAATGARVSELVQFKVEHLKLGYMDLYSKGGKVRRIYLPDPLIKETFLWLEGQSIDSGFIFLNHHGVRITTRGISSQLKKLAHDYQIDASTIYPHSFRHRFAKNFLERFNDISLLADLLGHENIETTRIYLKKSSSEQRQFIDEVVVW